ncbi:hypothetical protein [Halobacteriovorax sp. HLS]|uniref:hypothetical protein n=1 Tax=Halobacteriovorax sp. HLS TaxID=2234000 RepID=UPI000FDC0B3A|nr:hypothetical protein [Halobacteriovorax sp. HLS]
MGISDLPRKFKLTPFTEYFLYANYSVTSIMILMDKNLIAEKDAIFSVVGACLSIFLIKIYSKYFSSTKRQIRQILGVFIVIPAPVILLVLSDKGFITNNEAYRIFEILSLISIGLIIFLANRSLIGDRNSLIKSSIGVCLYFIYFEGLEYLKSLFI